MFSSSETYITIQPPLQAHSQEYRHSQKDWMDSTSAKVVVVVVVEGEEGGGAMTSYVNQ